MKKTPWIAYTLFHLTLLTLPISATNAADSTLTESSPSYSGEEKKELKDEKYDNSNLADDIELSGSGLLTALLFDPTSATAFDPEPIRRRATPFAAGGAYMDNNSIIYVDNLFNTPGQPPASKTPVLRVVGGQIVDY